MKIHIYDKSEEFAYLLRSLIRPVFLDIKITETPNTSKCDLLLAKESEIKTFKDLDKSKILFIDKELKRPMRSDQIKSVVVAYAIGKKLYEPITCVKKERKEESFAEALEKSKEMTRAKEAKKLKKARRITKGNG